MSPGPFKWVKPEVYPIIIPVAFALGAMTYSLARHLLSNPEVFPTKKLRQEGVPEDYGRAESHKDASIFRRAQEGKPLTGIFGTESK